MNRTCFLNFVALLLIASSFQARALADSPADKASPKEQAAKAKNTRTIGIVLYPMFETLDVFGPVEVFGNVTQGLKVVTVAEKAGPVTSAQGPKVEADYGFDDCP